MNSLTKGVIIFLVVILIWAGGFAVYYFMENRTPQTPITTTTETSTTDQIVMPAEDLLYIETWQYYDAMVITAVNNLNNLLANPNPNDTTWTQSIQTEASSIYSLYPAIGSMNIPANMMQAHNYYYYSVMGNYYYAVQYAINGVNTANAGDFATALAYMQSGTQYRDHFIIILNNYINAFH